MNSLERTGSCKREGSYLPLTPSQNLLGHKVSYQPCSSASPVLAPLQRARSLPGPTPLAKQCSLNGICIQISPSTSSGVNKISTALFPLERAKELAKSTEPQKLGEVENAIVYMWEKILQNPQKVIELQIEWIRDSSQAILIQRVDHEKKLAKIGFTWQLSYLDEKSHKSAIELISSFYHLFDTSTSFSKKQTEEALQQAYLTALAYMQLGRDVLSGNHPLSSRNFVENQSSSNFRLEKESTLFSMHFNSLPLPNFIVSKSIASPSKFSSPAAKSSFTTLKTGLSNLQRRGALMAQLRSFLRAKVVDHKRDFRGEAEAILLFLTSLMQKQTERRFQHSLQKEAEERHFFSSLDALESIVTSWSSCSSLPIDTQKLEQIYSTLCAWQVDPELVLLNTVLNIKSAEISHLRLNPTESGFSISKPLYRSQSDFFSKTAGQVARAVRTGQELGIIDFYEMSYLQMQIPYLEDAMACFNQSLLWPKTEWATHDLRAYEYDKWLIKNAQSSSASKPPVKGELTHFSSSDVESVREEQYIEIGEIFPSKYHFGWTISQRGRKSFLVYKNGENVAFKPD